MTMTKNNLEKLFTPIKIGSMTLKNRIVFPAMGSGFNRMDGGPTDEFIAYYEARAKGGVGLIIIETTGVEERARPKVKGSGIWSDNLIPDWAKVVKAIKNAGAKICLQLGHQGRQTHPALIRGMQPVSSSPLPDPLYKAVPHELTIEEIEQFIDHYAQAARRSVEAGFDSVQIHATHGYLPAQFLSAYQNKRADEYGGSLQARLQFPLKIIKAVKKMVGNDYPVSLRIAGYETRPGGRSLQETQYIAPILVEAGVDYLDVTLGSHPDIELIVPPSIYPQGFNVSSAEAVKKMVDVPVVTTGRICDPLFAEWILEQGKADLIGMGRALIADPDLPNKAQYGDLDDIDLCIGCNNGCIPRVPKNPDGTPRPENPILCSVNPFSGHESMWSIKPAAKVKKVLVIGGGPGGMKAAQIAAERGHQVTLWEKADRLGGQLNIAAIPPFKQEISTFNKGLRRKISKAGVKVELGKEGTVSTIAEMKPDVVFVATGARPFIPNIPGADKPNVLIAEEVLCGKTLEKTGDRVVVIGGDSTGCETADFLSEYCKEITIIEQLPEIAFGMSLTAKPTLFRRFAAHAGIKQITSAKVTRINDDGIEYETKDGRKDTLSGKTSVVLAVGYKSVDDLSEKIKDITAEVYVIGDAKKPRSCLEATTEAVEIALNI